MNQKVEIVKLDLNFLEAPNPFGDNYVNVTKNSPESFSVRELLLFICTLYLYLYVYMLENTLAVY